MDVLALILIIVWIGMPLGYAWWICRIEEPSRAAWLMKAAYGLGIALFVLAIGRWDIAGYYTRFVLLAFLAAAVICSWRRHWARPWWAPDEPSLWRNRPRALLPLVLVGAAGAYVVAGAVPPGDARSLAFPLAEGRFMVVQGGANMLLNRHHAHPAQRYAADIVALDAAGFRASGIHPDDPARYVAYGAAVVSPCRGEVVERRDGLPDLAPPMTDPDNPAGNHLVIACDGMLVELAHLQNHSIAVEVGDRLATGQPIARVGNSGNTTEPHLHIHAVDAAGVGLPMILDGRFPVRNRVFRR